MGIPSDRRFGAVTVICGSLLLVGYGALFLVVLPIRSGTFDYVQVVSSRWWVPLTATAMLGVLLLLLGLDAVYATVRTSARIWGWIGYLMLKVALILQACKLTWQLFLDPIIAARPESQFLYRDAIFMSDPSVAFFRLIAAAAIIAGALLVGATLYRSGLVPKKAVGLMALGALGYAVGFLVSVYLAVAGIIMLGIGCVMVGVCLWQPVHRSGEGAAPAPPNEKTE